MTVILALGKEAEAREVPQVRGQPVKFQTHQNNMARPSLKEKIKTRIITIIT